MDGMAGGIRVGFMAYFSSSNLHVGKALFFASIKHVLYSKDQHGLSWTCGGNRWKHRMLRPTKICPSALRGETHRRRFLASQQIQVYNGQCLGGLLSHTQIRRLYRHKLRSASVRIFQHLSEYTPYMDVNECQ